MAKGKEHMNLAFIGHVDHGKSTWWVTYCYSPELSLNNSYLTEKTSSDSLWTNCPKKEKEE